MKKILILPAVLFILTPQILLAKKSSRKPTQTKTLAAAKVQPLYIRIVSGEKVSLFTIYKTADGGRAELAGKSKEKSSVALTPRDYEFLKGKLTKIPGASNNKKLCPRNYISVFVGGKETVGCIGSANPTARDLQATANLISLLF